jgi:hypothetical protein
VEIRQKKYIKARLSVSLVMKKKLNLLLGLVISLDLSRVNSVNLKIIIVNNPPPLPGQRVAFGDPFL